MKRKWTAVLLAAMLGCSMLAGCGAGETTTQSTSEAAVQSTSGEGAQNASESEAPDLSESAKPDAADSAAQSTSESAVQETEDAASVSDSVPADQARAPLEDGMYLADFETDSTMFHLNEMSEGKGILTVENGTMTIHITLVSKSIVNLYPGLSEDAQKEGAELLEPTIDSVTYKDGITEEVNGYDVPVPVLDEDFSVAIIGTHGNWYDHIVSVSNPEPYSGPVPYTGEA